MKKLLLIFLLFSVNLLAESESITLLQADKLIADKQYESAFKILDNFDKSNSNPDIVIAKLDLLLKYFVMSVNHLDFSLKDLQANENIADIRGQKGVYSIHTFPADSIINNLIKKFPNNCKLYKSLGYYYYEMYQYFNDKPPIDIHTLHDKIFINFKKVIEEKCDDYMTHYIIGFTYAIRSNYKESIPYLLKSIELNNKYPNAKYNLAFVYTLTNKKDEALKYALGAFEEYPNGKYKSDAARLIGNLYLEKNDESNALKYFENANNVFQNSYYNLKPLLNLYVKTNNKNTKEYTKKFFDLEPVNPTIYNDLIDVYKSNNKIQELIEFFLEELKNPKNENLVNANLNFYLGTASLNINKKNAKEYYDKARTIFEKIYKADHAVFKAIQEGIDKSEK